MKPAFAVIFLPLLFSQEIPAPPKPVGVKITRPGVSGVATTPPVGGTLVTYGYSWEEPTAGASLQGITSFYEHTFTRHIALLATTTEPLLRAGRLGLGDTCPGIKFRSADETRYRPLLAVTYSIKVPLASPGFGTGRYDHKVNLAADKGIGRTRWTGNFATTWAAQTDGTFQRQYLPSIAAVTRWHSRWGSALQGYWTTAGKGYGGIVAAPFVQVNSGFNIFAGGMRNAGRCSTRYGLVAGFNYLHRPRH